ncbi:MAG: CDP-alcohol phosphatidyltransferase family protein [Planctomycetales bacterium]
MRRPRVFAVLPTLLTLGNAACGFGAITFAAKLGPEAVPGDEVQLLIAGLLIFLAMVFDALDGSAARWSGHTSDFGAQLDSLCDGISFGVAPAFMMLKMMQVDYYSKLFPDDPLTLPFAYPPRLLWVIAILFVACALLRLARFNVETEEDDSHEFFSGLPSPSAAGTVAAFPIAFRGVRELIAASETGPPPAWLVELMQFAVPAMKITLPLVTLAVACLMVSRFRYPHIVNQLFRGQRSRKHVIQVVFTFAAVFLAREIALLIIFCWYAFASPLRAAWMELVVPRLYKSRKV